MITLDRRLGRRRVLELGAGALALSAMAVPAAAETAQVRIGMQYGIAYLPLRIMKSRKLVEAHARRLGLGEIKTVWSQLGSGVAMNESLLSGNLDVASGGVTMFLNLWDKTRGNLDVRGVAALQSLPMYLVSSNPAVRSLQDFTDKDRIALVSVKVGTMAVALQMGAEQVWGVGRHGTLDRLTVSMKHPDALAALTSGRTEVSAYFGSPPYQNQALQVPGIHKVLSSYDILGGPHTFNMVWAKAGFRKDNPKTCQAFYAAFSEAQDLINQDPLTAARLYVEEEQSSLDPAFVASILTDADVRFANAPLNIMKFADFMHRVGLIKSRPSDWRELFLPEVHGEPGS